MPPQVSYWTGIWDPSREALSKEVDVLRRAFGTPARVVSFSSGQRSSLLPRDGVIRLSGRRWIILRTLAAALEHTSEITHVLGDMHAWHLLRALGRRPIVFTVAVPGSPLERRLYDKVGVFAPESEALADALIQAGVPASKIAPVYPGVDVIRFSPPPQRPEGRCRVVFASSPASVREFDDRGIPLLIEAARLVPEIEVLLQWRQWGDLRGAENALAALKPPDNLLVQHGDVSDMASVFRSTHGTVWLGAAGRGKSCPNSIVEGLACGCAAIVSAECGIAGLIAREGAGLVVAERTPTAVAAALRRLAAAPDEFRLNARSLALRCFALDVFLERYREIYAATVFNAGAN